MKLTENQLRKLIRKTIKDNWGLVKEQSGRPPATQDYVLKMLGKHGKRGLGAAASGDFISAANAVMDALWVDDPWPEDEEALEDMIQDAEVQSLEDLAAVGAEWLTKFRQGGWHDHSKPVDWDNFPNSLRRRPR